MRRPTKVLILTALLMVGLPVLAWTATFLYWHVRISRCIHHLEGRRMATGSRPDDVIEAHDFLANIGCRALPYLIDGLDPGKIPEFLGSASFYAALRSLHVGSDRRKTDEEVQERFREWRINPEDPPDVIRRKAGLIRAWWIKHRGRHHPWWRVWSFACGEDP